MSSKECLSPGKPPEAEKSPEAISPIRKLFIANRGEIAVRTIKACEKRGIPAVITYFSPPKEAPEDIPEDENSLARRMAEKKGWKTVPIKNYMDQEEILEKAKSSECNAIFLGYGFLSEDAKFVKKCEDAGLKVLAPPSEVMEESIKNKITAKKTAEGLQIPTLNEIRDQPKLEFPIMLKISNMGGGKGNCVAHDMKELETAFNKLLGMCNESGKILMEHYIENAVHVEIQIAADKHGNVASLGERDCTMQRKHQKVIEESPSPHITDQMQKEMQNAAIKFAKKIGYQGIGTWEFIVDKNKKRKNGNLAWYFMEINPRIQVEHGVTEEQTGIDLVNLMMDIAEGKRVPKQKKIKSRGYTIEGRLCAEDPENKTMPFMPSPGRISKINFPEDEQVRVDAGAEDGDEMFSIFDSLIAKIIVHGTTREEARIKLIDFLEKTTVEGVNCNKEFLIELLNSKEFRNRKATTSFVGNFLNRAKEGLKEGLKKTRRKLRRKAIIFRRKRRKKGHNGNGKKH